MHIPGREEERTGVPALYAGLGYVLAQIVITVLVIGVASVLGMLFIGMWLEDLLPRADPYGPPSTELAQIIGMVVGFLVGLIVWFRISFVWELLFPEEHNSHGSARFADVSEVSTLAAGTRTRAARLLIGCDLASGGFLSYDGPAHLMTLAPTRSGKGVGTLIPNLLTVDRSVLVIDPKGENARITGEARAAFGDLHVLDPFGISGHPSAAFNPLAELDPKSMDLGEDAAALADALVFDPPDQVKDSHWNEEARALITGFILWCVCHEPPERRTLGRLREVLTGSLEERAALLVAMQDSTLAGGLIARAANRHLAKPEREAGSVLSNAQRHTHFLDSPRMVQVTDTSSFRFAELAKRTVSVFVVLPPDRLDTYARWLRLIIGQALQDIVRDAQSAEMCGDVFEDVLDEEDGFDADDLTPISVNAEPMAAETNGGGHLTPLPRVVEDIASGVDDASLVTPQRGGIEDDVGQNAGSDAPAHSGERETASQRDGEAAVPVGEDGTVSPTPRVPTAAIEALTASQVATDGLDTTTGAVAASEGLLSPKIASAIAMRLQEPPEDVQEGRNALEAVAAIKTAPKASESRQGEPQGVLDTHAGPAEAETPPAPSEDASERSDSWSQAQRGKNARTGTQAAKTAPRPPTLFLMDEFASLGRLSAVERAMGLMAGYGVQLWPILQDLSQLKVLYGESANTFMANSGVIQTFGVNDYETAKWLSLNLGQETRYFQTTDHMADSDKNVHARDLLTPDEIMRLDPSLQILKVQNMRPVVAKKIVYYSDKRFDPSWVEPEELVTHVSKGKAQEVQFTRQRTVRRRQR